MAEPSKRTWPWKKKLQDKAALAPDSLESSPRASPHNSKFFDEQDVSKILSDHARVSDEAMTQWQHSESKLRQLSDKLHDAQSELIAKNILVKQHAKVAEEAVTGWEKAEAEAGSLKQQLDNILHQKLATEDRVSHLDGALKECMRQLRHVREEQEQRIHETIVKKTREYDKLREDMEVKLAEVGHDLEGARSEILECRSEARATSIVLEDNRKLLAELNDSKARSEGEVIVLQVQLESMEKENSTSKYELQILTKELEIRNEEREYERKVTENAGKNQVENAKKITILEAECHRLRMLMRKKLPGPAALAQMKIEVDSLDSTSIGFDSKRKSFGVGRTVRSLCRESTRHFIDLPKESLCDSCPERSGPNQEAGVLPERLVGMDDELKMLKEALVRRDQELQVSRLMCAKTASKLSTVEEQLEITLKRCKSKSIDAHGSSWKGGLRVGDEAVDSWDAASALLAELDQFKKATNRKPRVDQLHLMDDFVEMERLAMATGEGQPVEDEDYTVEEVSEKSFSGVATAFEDKLIAKERELAEANRLCKEISEQLFQAEEKVSSLQSRNIANETVLVTLQAKLDRFCDKGEDDGTKDLNITKELEDLVEAQSISLRAGAANEAILYDLEEGSQSGVEADNGVQRYSSSRSTSEMKYQETEEHASVSSDVEPQSIILRSDLLLSAVSKVLLGVAALVQAAGSDNEFAPTFESGHENEPVQDIQFYNFTQWKHPDLCNGMQSLTGVTHKLLQGKTDVVEFLTQLAAVLNCLVISHSRKVDQFVERIGIAPDCSSGQKNKELPLTGLEKGCLISQMVDLKEDSYAHNVGQVEVERGIVVASDSFRSSNQESQEGENSHLRIGGSNGHLEDQRQIWSISKCELDRDMLLLYKKVAALEGELQGERQQHQDVVLKYLDLQQQFHSQGAGSTSSAGSITRDCSEWDSGGSHQIQSPDLALGEMQVGKDVQIQSAAEKLAECQRSILDLGKQLKDLASPSTCDSLNALIESDTTCSLDRLSPYTDHIRSQLHTRDNDSGNNTAGHVKKDSNCTKFVPDITSQSTAGRDYVPCSPFLDWRSSLNPATSLISEDIDCNVTRYPVVSVGSPLVLEINKADQAHSGSENEKQIEAGNYMGSSHSLRT